MAITRCNSPKTISNQAGQGDVGALRPARAWWRGCCVIALSPGRPVERLPVLPPRVSALGSPSTMCSITSWFWLRSPALVAASNSRSCRACASWRVRSRARRSVLMFAGLGLDKRNSRSRAAARRSGRVYSVVSVLLTLLANKQADGGPATLVSVAEVGSLSVVVVQPGVEIGPESLDTLVATLPQPGSEGFG